jgi:hypothetical protein
MQAKPLGLIGIFYQKPCFDFENMFDVGLKPFYGFYKNLEIDLTLFGCIMQDLRKK